MTYKLYVGNLPAQSNESDIINVLRQTFEGMGEMSDLFLIRDKASNHHRGFGFVCFEDEQGANNAMQMDGKRIFENVEKPLKMDRARERRQQPLHANNATPFNNYNKPAGNNYNKPTGNNYNKPTVSNYNNPPNFQQPSWESQQPWQQ